MGHLSETMERIRAERIARRSFPNNSNKESESVENDKNSGCNKENIKEEDIEKTKDINGAICEIASDIDKLLVDLKNNEPTSDNQFFRLAILAYEMGDLNRSIVYAERFKNDEKTRIAHLANGKLALADILTQLYMLCLSLRWDFNALRRLGAEHFKERQEDFKKQGWSEIK